MIDSGSGFCFGVRRAIATLEEKLEERDGVCCVGDIVHNEREIQRLEQKGLRVINTADMANLEAGSAVLFRAHGEPPSSYRMVKEHKLKLTDATCPVVLKLQARIREAWQRLKQEGGQVVVFGKKGHAEVIGLVGQTDNECILVENASQVESIDPSKVTEVFSQTTQDPGEYEHLLDEIRKHVRAEVRAHHTICKQMSERAEHLREFAAAHDMIIFVGGAKSSNSKVLFEICQGINERSHFVTSEDEVDGEWFTRAPLSSVGIFGATSTPLWLMEKVKARIEGLRGEK